jgi:outer membrane protein OmpA-like peptidoglycan-associated protein
MRRSFILLALPLIFIMAGCHLLGPERVVVYFEAKSSHLDAQARSLLAAVAERARQRPGATVMVNGYTGPTGSVADNLMLAEQRSQAVADALVAAGVDARQIQRHAIGGVDFSMDSIESRRVEITLGEP